MMKHRASKAILGRLPILKSGVSRREFLHDVTAAAASMAFGGFVRSALAQEMADIIFRGGPILTMNQKSPRAETLAIRGERILAVGSVADVDALRGTSTRSIDLAILTSVMQADPPIRYRGSLISTLVDDWDKAGVKPNQGDDRFRMNIIKAWSDGAGQAYTAYQRENYLGRDHRGSLNYSLEELLAAMDLHDGTSMGSSVVAFDRVPTMSLLSDLLAESPSLSAMVHRFNTYVMSTTAIYTLADESSAASAECCREMWLKRPDPDVFADWIHFDLKALWG